MSEVKLKAETDYYEIVRQKLTLGHYTLPKHEKITELMKIFWDEDTIKLLSYFPDAGETISPNEIAEKSGVPRKEVKKLLKQAAERRTIAKVGRNFSLHTLLPGVFEAYFIAQKDTPENLKAAAKIYRYLFEAGEEVKTSSVSKPLFSPLLPYETTEKLIKIDEGVDIQSVVLPYQLVEELIKQNEYFAVIPCQCRLIAELDEDSEPCKLVPAEDGCFIAGTRAEAIARLGMGRALTKEEAIEYIKKTEKAGLVHNASFDTNANRFFICNCCPCHCGVIGGTKKFGSLSQHKSNFAPKINDEICVRCRTCAQKCPMEVITYSEAEDKMEINLDSCIGCGICASNCAKNAISMEKVRDEIPPERNIIAKNKTFGDMVTELLLSQ